MFILFKLIISIFQIVIACGFNLEFGIFKNSSREEDLDKIEEIVNYIDMISNFILTFIVVAAIILVKKILNILNDVIDSDEVLKYCY